MEDLKISELALRSDAEKRKKEKDLLDEETAQLKKGISSGFSIVNQRTDTYGVLGGSLGIHTGEQDIAKEIKSREEKLNKLDTQNKEYETIVNQIQELNKMLADDYVASRI